MLPWHKDEKLLLFMAEVDNAKDEQGEDEDEEDAAASWKCQSHRRNKSKRERERVKERKGASLSWRNEA